MKKKTLYGDTVKDQLKASARDRVHTFLLADGTVRGAFINGTRMVNEMRANFDLGILETLVAGHAYLAAGLMSSNLKGNDRIVMQIQCSGPIKGLVVEVNAFGEVRGYLKNVPIPLERPLESFELSPFFGAGFLTITKYLESMKQPYTGQVALQYGGIAEDLAHYFYSSEQTPTVFNLSVQFDQEGNVTGAGGIFLQVMPGASDSVAEGLETILKSFPSPGKKMAESIDPEALIAEHFNKYNPKFLNSYRVEFFCRCNDKAIEHHISMLPMDDLMEIRDNGPFPMEVKCHNCNTDYHFEKADIETMISRRTH